MDENNIFPKIKIFDWGIYMPIAILFFGWALWGIPIVFKRIDLMQVNGLEKFTIPLGFLFILGTCVSLKLIKQRKMIVLSTIAVYVIVSVVTFIARKADWYVIYPIWMIVVLVNYRDSKQEE